MAIMEISYQILMISRRKYKLMEIHRKSLSVNWGKVVILFKTNGKNSKKAAEIFHDPYSEIKFATHGKTPGHIIETYSKTTGVGGIKKARPPANL